MEIITSIAKWLFLESIYGIAVIAVVVYFIAVGIKKVIPKSPNPVAVAALAFVAALFTLPSLPRYQFERESLAQIEGKEWIRVISKTNWGSIAEPGLGLAPRSNQFSWLCRTAQLKAAIEKSC